MEKMALVTVTRIATLMTDPLQLNRLLQLCSANLPVGGFSFSQGLESATEFMWIKNASDTKSWICINMRESVARTDVASIKRIYEAIAQKSISDILKWNDFLLASRESHELLLADEAMGKAMLRLLNNLENIDIEIYTNEFESRSISFVCAFTIAAYVFGIDVLSAQSGFCWTVIDNQVTAATKLVPLGQTQAQNLLFEISEDIQKWLDIANSLSDDDIGGSLPHLAMASAWHETQYSRLFRS